MGKPAESVTLDDDVQEALHKLAERSGRPQHARCQPAAHASAIAAFDRSGG